MPLDQRWFEEEAVEFVAQVVDLRQEEGNYGAQIVVELKDMNPDILGPRLLFFRASRHSNGKWMRWLRGLKHLGIPVTTGNELLGNWLHIRELREEFEIEGDIVESRYPRVMAVYADEDAAHEVYEKLPKPTIAEPAMGFPEMEQLQKLWDNVKGNEDTFRIAAEPLIPEGMTMDDVIASLGG